MFGLLLDKRLDLGRRQHADKLIDDCAVVERFDSRQSADL